MRYLGPLIAAWALAFGPLASAETAGTTKAPIDAIKASVQASFTKLDISMVDIQVMFMHGTAVGKSASTGSRVIVSFTQIPGEETKVAVTTDGPSDPTLERNVLDTVIGGLQ